MKVSVKKVIEIEGVGIYREISSWGEFTKWQEVKNPLMEITTVDVNENNLMGAFFGAFSDMDKEVTIVMMDSASAELLKRVGGFGNTNK